MTPQADEYAIRRHVLPDEAEMGARAAADVAAELRDWTVRRGAPVLACFAAAPSQDAFLDALCAEDGVDWSRVHAIHLDEYVDLPRNHPNTFEVYLRDHLFARVPMPPDQVHYVKAVAGEGPDAIARAYAARVAELVGWVRAAGGPYLACIGIGVNGHIAFNEPHVDKRTARLFLPVELDEVSVRQQFDDYRNHPDPAARYADLDAVPRRAVTMSCAGVLAADRVFCIVPGAHKAAAVRAMWDGPVTEELPASLLRLHAHVDLYVDAAAASELAQAPRADL